MISELKNAYIFVYYRSLYEEENILECLFKTIYILISLNLKKSKYAYAKNKSISNVIQIIQNYTIHLLESVFNYICKFL
jgi:hypothetical protein